MKCAYVVDDLLEFELFGGAYVCDTNDGSSSEVDID